MPENPKTYLGDGAYAEFDGYSICLTAENGISVTSCIVLEPEVYEALVKFAVRVWGPKAAPSIESCLTCGGGMVNTGGPDDVCAQCGRTPSEQRTHAESRHG